MKRDLIAHFGERYHRYRDKVGMLLPWPRKASRRALVSQSMLEQNRSSAITCQGDSRTTPDANFNVQF